MRIIKVPLRFLHNNVPYEYVLVQLNHATQDDPDGKARDEPWIVFTFILREITIVHGDRNTETFEGFQIPDPE